MERMGLKHYNLRRLKGNQDEDLISMIYPYVGRHWGKVSWNIWDKHMDRFDEVMRRRIAIEQELKLYEDIDIRGKFISGLK